MIADYIEGSNCEKWSGGSENFSAASGRWIHAAKSTGGPKLSDDQSVTISQHNMAEAFILNYSWSKGGSSNNPFVGASPGSQSSGLNFTTLPSSEPANPGVQENGLTLGAKTGLGIGIGLATLLLGVTFCLYLLRRRRTDEGQPQGIPPELGGVEKSNSKRFLRGRWRAEVHGSSKLVEIDSTPVNELDATLPPREMPAGSRGGV
jgi:hypothetical protein